MEMTQHLQAVGIAEDARDESGLEHPAIGIFDSIRPYLVETGLSPEPPTYEIFYLYMTGMDPGLSTELERAIARGELTPTVLNQLRARYLGAIASSEVSGAVTHAKNVVKRLGAELSRSYDDLDRFGQMTAYEDTLLSEDPSRDTLLRVVENLQRLNSQILGAARRLKAEVKQAQMESAELLSQLEVADHRGRIDPLTGLLNRRGLVDTLQKLMAHPDQQELSIALVDIDEFRQVNDKWGPSIGDEVLRCVAEQLSDFITGQSLTGDAVVGRYGGELFLVLLPGLGLTSATKLIDTARATMARKIIRRAVDGLSLGRVTFSAGVAARRARDSEPALVNRADAALYLAKSTGRDRVLAEKRRPEEVC